MTGYSTFFNIEYYQYLFDIDATEVVQRWYVRLAAEQPAASPMQTWRCPTPDSNE